MRYRRSCQLLLVRFDAAAAAVIDAAGGPDGVWLAFGDLRRYGHPVLDRAPWLVVDRDRRLAYDGVLLLCAGPPGTAQLRTGAADVVPAVVVAVTARGPSGSAVLRVAPPGRADPPAPPAPRPGSGSPALPAHVVGQPAATAP